MRAVAAALVMVAFSPPAVAQVQGCEALRDLFADYQTAMKSSVALAASATTTMAIIDAAGGIKKAAIPMVSSDILDPMLDKAKAESERHKYWAAAVASACPLSP